MMLPMTLPTDFLFDAEFCSRLGLVLLHSLWQVAALTMVAWGVERLWLKRSVEGSYGIYVAALLAALVAMPVTFGMLDRGVERSALQTAEAVAPVDALVSNMQPVGPLPIENFELQVAPAAVASSPELAVASVPVVAPSVWQRAAPWLVVVYGLGVVLMLVRLVRAWVSTHRLGSRAATVVDGPLVEMLQTLAQRWSLRVVPILAETREIVVPKVVGLARPMILLPTAAMAGLSTEELEMILAHELAHVRRHDMWVNLLQRLAEVVLFFNPALWLVSRRISTLREYCCDEMTCEAMAGAESKNDPEPKLRYATALLRVAELAQPNAHNDLAALAASGRSTSELRRRVARLFGEPVQEPVRVSRAGVFTLVTVALLIAFGPVIWRSEAQTAESMAATDELPTTDDEYTHPITVSGTALDTEGTPIADAKIYLAAERPGYRRLAETTTDKEGGYRFDNVPLPIHRADTNDGIDSGSFVVFGIAKGFALSWDRSWSFRTNVKHESMSTYIDGKEVPSGFGTEDKIDLELTFMQPHSFRGRVVDDLGKPLADTHVEIRSCRTVRKRGENWLLSSDDLSVLNERAIVPPSLKIRKTDKEGRFEFSELPSGYLWRIHVRPKQNPSRYILVATGDHDEEFRMLVRGGETIYREDFEIVFARPREVEFRVVYDDTGKPAEKVGVAGSGFLVTTDKNGFASTRLPDGEYKLTVLPRYQTPYLRSSGQEVDVSEASSKQPIQLRLYPAGVVDISVVD
ncbi:MAG: M48 family metalloprotease, partial [Planctomycetes bacterium]|nr:M48 family metalloprotease [Planctomycetota bacterium]